MPAPSCRMYPARNKNLWLATSASAGASRRVGINSFDQRCILRELSQSASVNSKWFRDGSHGREREAGARVRGKDGGIHRTVIKPGNALSTITDAMYNEPLTFEVVSGSTADTRIFRLHGPITLSNLFEFQKALQGGTEKL